MILDPKKLNILTLVPNEIIPEIKIVEKKWHKYFNINHIIDTPDNLPKYTNSKIDILFLWSKKSEVFELGFYKTFQEMRKSFKYILLKQDYKETDYNLFKMLVDDIVYFNERNFFKWKTLSILRRYWNNYSKPSTIIYDGIIADFIDNKFIVNGKDVELTKKESNLLRYFMNNIGEYTQKNEIFEKVWGYKDDPSRTLDQMVFKLKRKIGPEYITLSRSKGFKFG